MLGLQILLLSILIIFPLVMMLYVGWRTRMMNRLLATFAMAGHLIIPLISWVAGYPELVIGYLLVINLLWAINPAVSYFTDKSKRRRMFIEDIKKYERIILRDPNNAAAHSALADAYRECERLDEAVAAYEKAIALDPDHHRADRWKLQQVKDTITRQERKAQPQPGEEPVQ